MPYRNTPPNKNFFGWYRDMVNNKLELYDGAGAVVAAASTATLALTGAVSATTTVAATTTVTGGTGVIATTGDVDTTAGNFRAGVKSAFGTTEPTSAVVLKVGTAPAGTITTSCGMFTDGTTMKKIIAANTISDIQT